MKAMAKILYNSNYAKKSVSGPNNSGLLKRAPYFILKYCVSLYVDQIT